MKLLPPVVLVEDDPARAEVVSLVLRGAYGGTSLRIVSDGVALARSLREPVVAAVLIRTGLGWAPVASTAALVRELHPDAAVVVLLGSDVRGEVEACLQLEAEGFVIADGTGLGRLPAALDAAVFRARRRRLATAKDQPYRDLFRSMGLGAFLAARDGTVLEANRAMAALLGAEGPEALLKRSIPDRLIEPEARDAWHSGLAGPSGSVELETAVRGLRDQPVAVLLRAWLVPESGAEPRIHGTVRAVTGRGPTSIAAGDAAGSEIEQLASAISHDLRQPLRVVDRSLELLMDAASDRLDAADAEHLTRARTAASDLDRLLEGILRWARLPSLGDELAPVSLDRVLDRVVERLEPDLEERGGTVERAPLPTVTADEGQLELLLQNLLDNALKFSGDRPPRVLVTAERKARAWHVSVRDDGIGIDPAATERVFGLFQRQDEDDAPPGHGIGLAVCRRIVLGHGGRIWIDPGADRGVTVHFTLPERGPETGEGAP